MKQEERFGNVRLIHAEDGLEELQGMRPEDAKIRELVEAGHDCRLGTDVSWPVLYHLSHLRGNLTEWLPIKATETALEFGADSGQLTGGLLKKASRVTCLEESLGRCRILARRHERARNLTVYAGNPWKTVSELQDRYDWIIACGLLSQAAGAFAGEEPEVEAIRRLKSFLKPGGRLALAEDNRFGLKYWAGAADPHTGRYFDCLEGGGGAYSRQELLRILKKSGCEKAVFYYPYPERWFPSAIYSEEWLPKAGELNRNLRNFEGERLALFDEEKVFDRLIADGRFADFSNAYLCIVGPESEEQPIYIKYSNDRARRFAVRTEILRTPQGRTVRKVPVSEEANAHIQDLKRREEELFGLYARNGVSVNRCELRGGAAYFEYIEGTTYEAALDRLRGRKDYAGLVAKLLDYKTLLLDTLGPKLEPFAVSAQFVEMFGRHSFPKAYRGALTNNLDWIFANLVETADGIQIIDYEWTFPVQVPVEYLLWRALSLYLHSREDIRGLGLMALLGVSPQEEALFEAMEHQFQLWLLDGAVTIDAQRQKTAGRTIALDDMLRSAGKSRMQVYLDTGGGFSEEGSRWIDARPDSYGIIRLELLLPAGTRSLRIDPAQEPCFVKIHRLLGELGGTYPLEALHNGRELEEQGILYTTTDPQITAEGIVEGTGRVYAELTVEALASDTAYACMHLLNRVRSAERISRSAPYRLLKKLKAAVKR